MVIPEDVLRRVLEKYESGLCVQAFSIGQPYGPLRHWEGARARLLAGRLADKVGAPRLSLALFLLTGRRAPDDLEAQFYHVAAILAWRGPFAAREALRRRAGLDCGPGAAKWRGPWLALHARVLGALRDFDEAEEYAARALEAAPDDPWVHIERSALHQAEDRYEDCLEAARRALDLRPWYPPGIQVAAHALTLLGRDDEAIETLKEATRHLESSAVMGQLAALQIELCRYEDARSSLGAFAALCPMIEEGLAEWLAARQADVAYYLGDREAAGSFARQIKSPFYQRFAERLSGPPGNDGRMLLPVAFVRQHHMTCSPATLAAVSRFWSKPAEHLAVADEICYDGTSAFSERQWADRNGWTTREFTVSWDPAVELLNRGVPFTLATVSGTQGHMQAVVGYDVCRGALMARDPFHRSLGEAPAEALFASQRATGPRGMALVPTEHAARLEGVDLPEAELYDRLYGMQKALSRHDRKGAREAYDAMAAEAPGHRLTLLARRSLAAYDTDPAALLVCHERLADLFPEDAWVQLGHLACMRDLTRREARLDLLQTLCGKPDCHPAFWGQYALELAGDAREHTRAIRLLRRALRCGLLDGATLHALGNIAWARGELEEGLGLFRLAACLDDKNEALAGGYFLAAHHLKRTDRAVRFLRERNRRFARLSAQPARTLFSALCRLRREKEAFEILEEALVQRATDGDLQLFAADAFARHGETGRAQELLAASQGRSRRADWLRTAAAIESYRGDLRRSLALWQEVLEIEPLAIDAHATVAQRLAETEGRAAMLEHLRAACDRFPHNVRLHQLRYDRLGQVDPAGAEAVLRHIIATHPADAWARRELSGRLGLQRRFAEAFAEASIAGSLEPSHPARWNVYGEVCALSGKIEEARNAWREAIRLDVDNTFAIERLMTSLPAAGQRHEALAFLRDELARQTTYGNGVLAFENQARDLLPAPDRLAALRSLFESRPDLWQSWAAVGRSLHELGRREEALDLLRKATVRFPLVPHVWHDLGRALESADDWQGAVEALRRALQIEPALTAAAQDLARVLVKAGRHESAREALEQALMRQPLDPGHHAVLARTLWGMGHRDAAINHLVEALRLAPGDMQLWRVLNGWAQEANRPDLPVETARDLTVRRSGDPQCWLMLARLLPGPTDAPEGLAAIDRAIDLDPFSLPAHETKATFLAQAGRFDEARAACRPPSWGEHVPVELRARAAWVEEAAGRHQEAIERMRAVLEERPDYVWGWIQIAEWHHAAGSHVEYLGAAERLGELAPSDPQALYHLGQARLLTGDREGGKAAWACALQSRPDHGVLAQCLFDAQLEDGDAEAAGRTSKLHGPHAIPERRHVMDIRLAAARRDAPAASAALRDLFLCPTLESWPFEVASEAMRRAGWGERLDQAMESLLQDPGANPILGALFIDSCSRFKRWRECEQRLEKLAPSGPLRCQAVLAYGNALARAGERKRLRRHVQRHRGTLREDSASWGSVGHDLLAVGETAMAADWMADWRERPAIEPWMLLNLAVCLRQLGRIEEAIGVSEAALRLPADQTTLLHRVRMALAEVLRGRTEAAAMHFRAVADQPLSRYYDFLRAVAEAMLVVQQSGPDERGGALTRAREILWKARARHSDYARFRELRRAHGEGVRRVSRDAPGAFATAWRIWRMVAP